MYSFTLPHKVKTVSFILPREYQWLITRWRAQAHAAGDDLPISVHFVPLGKGIRVKEITTEIRENLIIYGKHGYQHNESHAIFIDKEDCDPNENSINRIQSQPTSAPLSRVASLAQLGDLQLSMSGSHSPSVTHSPSVPSPQPSVSSGVAPHDLSSRLAKIKVRGDERTPPYNGNSGGQPTQTSSGYLSPRSRSGTGSRNDPQSQFVQRVQEALEPEPAFEPLDDQDLPPSEKHMVFHVRIPKFAAPSNAMSPAVISHRIRWTCLIECVSFDLSVAD